MTLKDMWLRRERSLQMLRALTTNKGTRKQLLAAQQEYYAWDDRMARAVLAGFKDRPPDKLQADGGEPHIRQRRASEKLVFRTQWASACRQRAVEISTAYVTASALFTKGQADEAQAVIDSTAAKHRFLPPWEDDRYSERTCGPRKAAVPAEQQ